MENHRHTMEIKFNPILQFYSIMTIVHGIQIKAGEFRYDEDYDEWMFYAEGHGLVWEELEYLSNELRLINQSE
jgi:hypothetical protein